jgi:hypothetical protein
MVGYPFELVDQVFAGDVALDHVAEAFAGTQMRVAGVSKTIGKSLIQPPVSSRYRWPPQV